MKVLNLRCAHEHRFEGWFGSDDDFVSQCERGLIACPLCDDKTVSRLPSAPRLNVSTQRGDDQPAAVHAKRAVAQGHEQLLKAARELLRRTEDVGDRFPEEARRIHYGEVAWRGIRGHASAEAADALREEGIEVVAVPLPDVLKSPLQ
jgi:hypothetical protein